MKSITSRCLLLGMLIVAILAPAHPGLADRARSHGQTPTRSGTGLVLNELMADNESVIFDNYAQHDDWFEIHNPGESAIPLDGLYVTNDLSQPMMHRLTGGLSVLPGGYLLLWADDQTFQGDEHCAFTLDTSSGELGLFAADGITQIDAVLFTEQFTDHSYARYPDGAAWTYSWYPTPGAANAAPRIDLFLRLNEVLADNVTINVDEASDHDPWLEVYNRLPIAQSVFGLALTDEPLNPTKWAFPDTVIGGYGHLLIWADDETGEGPLHASFQLEPGGGFLGLYNLDGPSTINTIGFFAQSPDTAYARIPDGEDNWEFTEFPTPSAPNQRGAVTPILYLNEFLASNQSVNQDEAGEYDDWCEIYNPGPDPVAMGGLYLTDDLENTTRWVFPDTVLAPDGYLLIWCDDDPYEGPLHTTFRLASGGEEIGLFERLEDGNRPIDTYVFEAQTVDVSEGRFPDGPGDWVFFGEPTPGGSNSVTAAAPGTGDDPETRIALQFCYPNPTGGPAILHYELTGPGRVPVSLDVYDVRGRHVRYLLNDVVSPGRHSTTWDRRDDGGRPVPAGVYFCRMASGAHRTTLKILLVK